MFGYEQTNLLFDAIKQ